MKTAVIYARFSSDNQTEMSIDAQIRACREYAEKHQLSIVNIYKDEAVSGTKATRIGYQAMLADALEDNFDTILIHKYDRIARNLEEQVTLNSRLKKLNITLIAVAQDYGVGKDADLTKGIQWVLGEYYSANLAEETRKGHREIALKALHNGGVPPFGYDIINQQYVIDEREAEYVRRMYECCITGKEYKPLVEEMATLGIVGKRGKPIKYTQIYEMLHNEKYIGTYVYSVVEEKDRALRRTKPNAIRIENALPAIIDKDTFTKAQVVLLEHKHAGAKKHSCSGLVYCAECGSKMFLSRTSRKGHYYENFRCSNKCGAHGVPVKLIDEAVNAYVDVLFSEKNICEVKNAIADNKASLHERIRNFEIERQAKLIKAQSELDTLSKALMSGAFTDNLDYCNNLLSIKRNELKAIKELKVPYEQPDKATDWLKNIKANNCLPKIFIKKIVASKTEIRIFSTFDEVVNNDESGPPQPTFPTTMYQYDYKS